MKVSSQNDFEALRSQHPSPYAHFHLLDGVVAVAEAVPLGRLWLSTTGKVGRTGAQRINTRLLNPRNQFPRLPTVTFAFAHETSLPPASASQAHFDTGNWGDPRP